MEEKSTYTLAGWLAIGAAVLALPLMVLGFMVDVATRRGADLLPVFLLLFFPFLLPARFAARLPPDRAASRISRYEASMHSA